VTKLLTVIALLMALATAANAATTTTHTTSGGNTNLWVIGRDYAEPEWILSVQKLKTHQSMTIQNNSDHDVVIKPYHKLTRKPKLPPKHAP
jgi:hypothetical protein